MDLQNGKYRGIAKSDGTLLESARGTPGISVEMGFSDERLAGLSLTWTGWLTEGAFNITVKALRAMGWTGTELDSVTGLAKEVELVVENEEYEGNWYPRIQFVNALGGAMGVMMAPDKARSFAAAMQARIRALDAAKGQAPTQSATQSRAPASRQQASYSGRNEPPPHTDDDIPF